MDKKGLRNRRLSLILLVTVAIVAIVLFVPGVALGLTATFDNGKIPAIYKVGETVLFDASIQFAAAEVSKIDAVTLNVQGDTSTAPGSENFQVDLPFLIGSHDITDLLPQSMQDRGSTLEVDVTWTDMGPADGGYTAGYKGASGNARIDFAIRWNPPIFRAAPPPPPPPLAAPGVAFPVPGGGAPGDNILDVNFLWGVPVVPESPFGSQVLGLAFDRFNFDLLVLMDNPGGNDTLLVVDPGSGFLFDIIDVGVTDAQDVTWMPDDTDGGKFGFVAGDVWIAFGPPNAKQVKNLDTLLTINIPNNLPIAGLGADAYDAIRPLIVSDLQTDADQGIPVRIQSTLAGTSTLLNIAAGPTGGGYDDVVKNDVVAPGATVFGSFGGTVAEFDLGGAFLGTKDVKVGTTFLDGVVGLALDQDGILYLANWSIDNAFGEIYSVDLTLEGAAGVGGFAVAITNDPNGEIFILLDDAGAGGSDRIVEVDDNGVETGVAFDGPSGGLEGLVFLNGFLYTVDNFNFPPRLYKLHPVTGAVEANYPKVLPNFVGEIGGLTVDTAGGTNLVAMNQFNNDLFFIDLNTGFVTFSTALNVPFQFPDPFGLDAITLVTGCPQCPLLLGARFTGFFSININNGDMLNFVPVNTFPPFGITGLTQRGDLILFTDDSQQVFKAGVPGAPPPENTVAGDYLATFSVVQDPPSPPPAQNALFTISRVDTLAVNITSPTTGDSFTDTPITVQGNVNDPTVATVTLGVDLPTTILFGNSDKTGPHGGETVAEREGANAFSTSGLWHYTNDFADPQNPRAIGQYSLAYTRDAVNAGTAPPGPLYTFETGLPNSGDATGEAFVVGQDTQFCSSYWYNNEGSIEFDLNLVRLKTFGVGTDLVDATQANQTGNPVLYQIVTFPPEFAGAFFPNPGTFFTLPNGNQGVFIPHFDIDPSGAPIVTQVCVSLDPFIGQTVRPQFSFDSVDATLNDGEGWFVDDIIVQGAGAADGQILPVVNLQWQGQFDLAPGNNDITATAVRTAYDAQTATDTITVSLDISNPIIALDVLPDVTNNAVLAVTGTYQEDNPALLTVKVNNKLVLSQKSFDANDLTFSVTVNLTSGVNNILVNLVDAGALEPVLANPANVLSDQVILDQTPPTLVTAGHATVYPLTATNATPGDPVVYQLSATDAETGIAKVEIFTPSSKLMFAAVGVPEVMRVEWGTTGNFLFPTVIPGTAVPGELSLTVKATDSAGNIATGVVKATVRPAMEAWNTCLQFTFNLVSLPIQPADGDIPTVLNQVVANVNPLFAIPAPPAKLSDVTESISYWTGGQSVAEGGTGTFQVYTPGPAADDLLVLKEGKAYWFLMKQGAHMETAPLPGFTAKSNPCMNMTIAGVFLPPGQVPPTFPVSSGWNMTGPHTEEDSTVQQFLAGVTFQNRNWTSLLNFVKKNDFDYSSDTVAPSNRVTATLGAFESRFDLADPARRGEGFWLFVVADGNITP